MTGVMMRTCIADEIIPPIIGVAMGFITSAPVPLDHIIGTRPRRATATVMSFGRRRSTAPSKVASWISRSVTGPLRRRLSRASWR